MPSGRPVRDTADFEAQEKEIIEKNMNMILQKLYDGVEAGKIAKALSGTHHVLIRTEKIYQIKKDNKIVHGR